MILLKNYYLLLMKVKQTLYKAIDPPSFMKLTW